VVVLSLIALVKAGLVIRYYMHIYRLYQETKTDPNSYEYKAGTLRLGLWLFLLSDAFAFGGLAVARFNLWGMTRPPLNQVLGLIITSVLLVSSFFMNRAETAMAHGERRNFVISLVITLLLGIGFLVGVIGIEWPSAIHEGITPSSNTLGAVFFNDDRYAWLPRFDGCDLPADRFAQRAAWIVFRRAPSSCGSGCRVLALRRCGLDFLLSGALPDWNSSLKCAVRSVWG